MTLHLERNREQTLKQAFEKLRRNFNWDPKIEIVVTSPSPIKSPTMSQMTTPTKKSAKKKKVAKGTKLASGFIHYLKPETEATGPSTAKTRRARVDRNLDLKND